MVIEENPNSSIILRSMEIEDQWQEGSPVENIDEFGVDPSVRWFVEYTIELDYPSQSLIRRLWQGDHSLNVGYISLIACSPAFKHDPTESVTGKMDTALVQDRFDTESAKKHVREHLSRVPVGSKKQMTQILRGFLSIN